MASIVESIGYGGQFFASKVLGWDRNTIRKGTKELESGHAIVDQYHRSGRKKSEYHFPNLLNDIKSIVEPSGQTDPTFRSTRIYTPLTTKEVRHRLVTQCGYRSSEFICERTIANKLNGLNYRPQKVKKCKPIKKIAETDAIFEQVHQINAEADDAEGILRISLDTKATVKIGEFSRNGKSRQPQKAIDHDFAPDHMLTPFGILQPKTGESHLWFCEGKVTADCMADCLEEMLPKWQAKKAFKELVINADNGPENSGQRTQWLKRLTEISDTQQIKITLAYYPPYHSKYNPVERLWGVLENHWRGEILNSIEKAIGMARSMTYKGIKPTVRRITRIYKTGVTVAKKNMQEIECRLNRKEGLEPWFITILPEAEFD